MLQVGQLYLKISTNKLEIKSFKNSIGKQIRQSQE
jgi:hypothetical protein